MRSHSFFYTPIIGGRAVIAFLLIVFAILVLFVRLAGGQGIPPVFELRFIGTGSPAGINNQRTIIGSRQTAGNYEPLVSIDGAPWTALPMPAGSMSTFPTDINNLGVIVGVSFSPQWSATSVRWTRVAGNYTLEVLPIMSGDTSSYATAINDLGQIVGARSSLGYQPTGTGWVYSDQAGFRRLTDFGFWITPRDINNSGLVIGGQERLNLATGQVEVTGQGPSNYNAVTSVAINSSGMMAGSATLRSSSLNIVSVFRYVSGVWTYISGTSRYTTAYDINDIGDIGYGELGAGLYLDGLGDYALYSLLSPETTAAGWVITGNGAYLNDSREVVTLGRNNVTGDNGTVLLIPAGNLPPPTAPSDLTATPHPATRMEPFNSIELAWVNTSPLTRSWELQRSIAGSDTWQTLQLIPPGINPRHSDSTVGVNITYNYRVRAVGLGGPSPWSNVVTVTSPPTPLDTTPPTVNLLEPVNGANVSGIVPVRSTATDNVAVEYHEISFWNQYTGQQVVIGSANSGGEITSGWDTRQLTAATYRVTAMAYDTLGNIARSEANVNVVASTASTMLVSSIRLYTATGKAGTSVNADVNVVDNRGAPVPGATVTVRWRMPNGHSQIQTGDTNPQGIATFSVPSLRGLYRFTIYDVVKAGFDFDRSASQMSAKYWR